MDLNINYLLVIFHHYANSIPPSLQINKFIFQEKSQ